MSFLPRFPLKNGATSSDPRRSACRGLACLRQHHTRYIRGQAVGLRPHQVETGRCSGQRTALATLRRGRPADGAGHDVWQGAIYGHGAAQGQQEAGRADGRLRVRIGGIRYRDGEEGVRGQKPGVFTTKILETDPPISALQPKMPPALDRVVKVVAD